MKNLGTLSLKASEAIAENKFVTITGNYEVGQADADDIIAGVATQNAEAGQSVGAEARGVVKVVSGAAVAVGDPVKSDADGAAIVAASGDDFCGVAITASTAAGEMVDVLLDSTGTVA